MFTNEDYEQMARERSKLAATYLDVLNHYAPEKEDFYLTELHRHITKAVRDTPSREAVELFDAYIRTLGTELKLHQIQNPEIEKKPEVRRKLSEIEQLLSSGRN